jgi:DNA/RNA-binding domain of Phe-tRNA-synthetase-like protein
VAVQNGRRLMHMQLWRDSVAMGVTKHTLNGLISLIISVVATVAMADSDDDGYSMEDMLLGVAVSAFLSGFFTSYFASK